MPLIHEVSAAEFIRMGLVLEEKQYVLPLAIYCVNNIIFQARSPTPAGHKVSAHKHAKGIYPAT
jgi:hypothetical protein